MDGVVLLRYWVEGLVQDLPLKKCAVYFSPSLFEEPSPGLAWPPGGERRRRRRRKAWADTRSADQDFCHGLRRRRRRRRSRRRPEKRKEKKGKKSQGPEWVRGDLLEHLPRFLRWGGETKRGSTGFHTANQARCWLLSQGSLGTPYTNITHSKASSHAEKANIGSYKH